jgi:hypothetical protein
MIISDAWVEDGVGIVEVRCTDAECGEIVLVKVEAE